MRPVGSCDHMRVFGIAIRITYNHNVLHRAHFHKHHSTLVNLFHQSLSVAVEEPSQKPFQVPHHDRPPQKTTVFLQLFRSVEVRGRFPGSVSQRHLRTVGDWNEKRFFPSDKTRWQHRLNELSFDSNPTPMFFFSLCVFRPDDELKWERVFGCRNFPGFWFGHASFRNWLPSSLDYCTPVGGGSVFVFAFAECDAHYSITPIEYTFK